MTTSSTVSALLTQLEANPKDKALRLIAADALEEAGHQDAAALRGDGEILIRSGLLWHGADRLVVLIEEELDRLDCLCSNNNPGALCVTADATLPRGWVRVYDTESAYGPAEEILAALEEVEYDGEVTVEVDDGYGGTISEQRDNGWELAWEALSQFGEAPVSSRDWPDDLCHSEQVEDGGPNDSPLTLIQIQTNAGERWTCGAHGVFTCALSEAFQYDDWHDSREAALASADSYAEQEEEEQEEEEVSGD